MNQMPMRQQDQQKPAATTNQLKVLVTQIQMAVQVKCVSLRVYDSFTNMK